MMPSYLAIDDDDGADDVIGVALLDRHFPEAGEIHLIAVERARHRGGAGRALVAAIENDLRADGARLMSVHTAGPSFDDPHYAETRRFYLAQGFIPLEEHTGLDWDGPDSHSR